MPAIIAITDALAENGAWLVAAEPVHRMLRPAIPHPYRGYMHRMFGEGAEMAVLTDNDAVHAIAVFRCHHTTYNGLRFYIDDLVTDEAARSRGHGGTLLRWCEDRARARGCHTFALDSGVQRTHAHRFYFRHGLSIVSFSFKKHLRDFG